MGAKIKIEGKTAIIKGVKKLYPSNVQATDLRGGAALVIAAIATKGTTKIENIEYRNDILIKIRNTAKQSSLNKEQRKENLKNAYVVNNNEYILNKNILIFDDIYTTGSTANECAKTLIEAGAKDVGILTIARD